MIIKKRALNIHMVQVALQNQVPCAFQTWWRHQPLTPVSVLIIYVLEEPQCKMSCWDENPTKAKSLLKA